MNTSEQHKATRGSCLLDLLLRPVVGVLGLLTVGEMGKVKNRESPKSTTEVGISAFLDRQFPMLPRRVGFWVW